MLYYKGCPVEVIWECKEVEDRGIKKPRGFFKAEYLELSAEDSFHELLFYFSNDNGDTFKTEQWVMYEKEFFPIIQEGELKVEEFV